MPKQRSIDRFVIHALSRQRLQERCSWRPSGDGRGDTKTPARSPRQPDGFDETRHENRSPASDSRCRTCHGPNTLEERRSRFMGAGASLADRASCPNPNRASVRFRRCRSVRQGERLTRFVCEPPGIVANAQVPSERPCAPSSSRSSTTLRAGQNETAPRGAVSCRIVSFLRDR